MARRRKDKSIVEAVGGLVMMIVALAILSPAFRGQVLSTLSLVFSIVILFGVAGLAVYLIVQLKKKDDLPSSPVNRNSARSRMAAQSTNPDSPQYSPEEQTRINHVIQSMQPSQVTSRPADWNESILSAIEWKRFEVVTKEFLSMTGYEAKETKIGADGGVDIRVTKTGAEGFEGIVQCKAWNTYRVGVKPVRELYGVMAAEKVSRGMLITSGGFTSEAEEFAKGKIVLISGARFLELILKLSEEKQKMLLDIAMEGDYRTPTCPQCDIKMTLREGKKGRNVGGQFWGCVRYPRCRQTLVYKEQEQSS